jgi:hypothetical protein
VASAPTDLLVTLQADRPAALAAATDVLGRAGINLDGLTEVGGELHVLTTDPPGATRALRAAGIRVSTGRPVAVVEVEDRPGAVAAVLRRLAALGRRVDFLYLATGTRLVLGVDDPEGIAKFLAK